MLSKLSNILVVSDVVWLSENLSKDDAEILQIQPLTTVERDLGIEHLCYLFVFSDLLAEEIRNKFKWKVAKETAVAGAICFIIPLKSSDIIRFIRHKDTFAFTCVDGIYHRLGDR